MTAPTSTGTWDGSKHRGIVIAKRGIVAASQPLAVSAGLEILMEGGSCVDAAIATSATLAVTEPYNSHLGGDAFVIYYHGASRSSLAFNGSGAAPASATRDEFTDGIPVRGLRAATLPGLVDCWFTLHRHGGRLPMKRLLQRAIAYASDGFPAGNRYASVFQAHAATRSEWFLSALSVLTGLDHPPLPGETIRQPALSRTLAAIADGGRQAFYERDIACKLVEFASARGGLFSLEDFATHQTEVLLPITTTYRGLTVHGQPPVSQGLILLEELNIVEGYDIAACGFGAPATIHLMVEAKKLAFDDRIRFMGDPRYVHAPTAELISKEHAANRRRYIALDRAMPHGSAPESSSDTTYFCVADDSGSAVSFIQSVYHAFGCGMVDPATGVLFNNRMLGFHLDPSSPNCLAPGKRPMHTLNAYLITDDERLRYVGGTPGGDVQVQSNLQVITSLVDFGMDVQQAVEAPRWQHVQAPDNRGLVLQLESRFAPETLRKLQAMGHPVMVIGPWNHGSSCQLIAVDPATGAYMGGSDPRCDGHCAGW